MDFRSFAPMELKCYLYNIPGIANMRDLGGYETTDGKTVKKGRFIRSTALKNIDDDSVSALLALPVDCVIDLRSKMERQRAPDVIENHGGVKFVHVPMLDNIQSNFATGDFGGTFPASMSEMYIGLLENSSASCKAVFDIFADNSLSHYLFHCTAGKDRTGVTAMLLLALAGVPDELIAEDYSYTQYITEPVPVDNLPFEVPEYLFESAPAEMLATIKHIRQNYGCAREYLTHIGVSKENIMTVKHKLLQD
jgi:protein-tyrosine phosphatase